MYVFLYLATIVLANLLVNHFGPDSSIYIAFLFIGFDLTLRDKLHRSWENKHLWIKMLLLISTGSIISYLLNKDAQHIAIASCVAFLGAGLVDTIIFSMLAERSEKIRINGSNIFSSITDSILFPAIAFGFPLMYGIMLGQIIAKIVGGYMWGKVLRLWK